MFGDYDGQLLISRKHGAGGERTGLVGDDMAQFTVLPHHAAAHEDAVLHLGALSDTDAGEYDAVFDLAFDNAVICHQFLVSGLDGASAAVLGASAIGWEI